MGGATFSLVFDQIKKAAANIAKFYYYNPTKDTRVKYDASHSGFGATLEQKTGEGEWMPIAFTSRYLKAQEKKFSKRT